MLPSKPERPNLEQFLDDEYDSFAQWYHYSPRSFKPTLYFIIGCGAMVWLAWVAS